MKRSKEYKNMFKRHKKSIMEQAKYASTDPFDWGVSLELLIKHLYFMRDYYKLGENVWAMEEKGKPTRLECLEMILAEYEDWMHCDDKYWGWDLGDTEDTFMWSKKPTPEETGRHIMKLKNLVYEDDNKNREAFEKEYKYHRKRFFELLEEYIESLWD